MLMPIIILILIIIVYLVKLTSDFSPLNIYFELASGSGSFYLINK